MKYFLYRLNPPRSTFPADMTAAEGNLMREHVAYWTGLMNQGRVIAFGPVADPKGAYGIGIIKLEEGEDPNALGENDPVVRANVGFRFEVHPMPQVVCSQQHA
jgi:uncharacterized protein